MKSKEILPESERPPTMPILGVYQKETLFDYAVKCTSALLAAEAEIESLEHRVDIIKQLIIEDIKHLEKEVDFPGSKQGEYFAAVISELNAKRSILEKLEGYF